jgi:glucose-1-phosphate cytidylyltransferase
MKVAVLAGGVGTRLVGEEVKPKPMIEIGGRPILWHIMMHYAHYGFQEFVIALGYKGEMIKRYMLDYCSLNSNLTVNLESGAVQIHDGPKPDWTVELVDTGIPTLTGGRIKRLAPYLGDQTFMLTWGDSVSDVDLDDLLAFHRSRGKLATMTVVHPAARFGHLDLEGDQVMEFSEKPQTRAGWINVDGDDTQWEREPLERLAKDGQLMAYRHTSFWQCMDTLRDKRLLEDLWQSGNAPWKNWRC